MSSTIFSAEAPGQLGPSPHWRGRASNAEWSTCVRNDEHQERDGTRLLYPPIDGPSWGSFFGSAAVGEVAQDAPRPGGGGIVAASVIDDFGFHDVCLDCYFQLALEAYGNRQSPGRPCLISQLNWLKKNEAPNSSPDEVYEYDVYSDARFTGQMQVPQWPYAFLNAIDLELGTVEAALVIRAAFHSQGNPDPPDWSKTDDTAYHGGWIDDELVALASLCLGARLASGGISRRFSVDDPYGQPARWSRKPKPPFVSRDRGMLPEVRGRHPLDGLSRIESIPHVESKRSSRWYVPAAYIEMRYGSRSGTQTLHGYCSCPLSKLALRTRAEMAGRARDSSTSRCALCQSHRIRDQKGMRCDSHGMSPT